jgi:hypothetical protein
MAQPRQSDPQPQAANPNITAALRSIGEGLISATGGTKKPGWLPSEGWLWGLAPVLFAALRVLVVSRGDAETLRALVQNLNVTALVLATILPFGAAVAVVSAFSLFFAWRPLGAQTPKGGPFLYLVLLSMTGVLVLFAMPVWQILVAIAAVAAIVVVLIFGRTITVRAQNSGRNGVGKPVMFLVIGALLIVPIGPIIYLIGWSGMWLPQERITFSNKDVSPVYILSSDQRWTTYMDGHRKVYLIPTLSITNREALGPSGSWLDKSLTEDTSDAVRAFSRRISDNC